jgi:peptidoglycan/LPS O-acetylase OafA/YrhL
MSPAPHQQRVPVLDVLRLFAVLGVAAFHFGLQGTDGMVAVPNVTSVTRYGFMGVPIFFVISGFVIAYSAQGRTASGFAIARFARIYPTFVLCMTITFLAMVLFGAPEFPASPLQWAANLLVVSPGQPYVDSAYWSLAVEIIFYGWVTLLIRLGLFQEDLFGPLLAWIAISLLNEMTVDIRFFGKTLLTDYSGFFATGILIYRMHVRKPDGRLLGLFALAVLTGMYQAVHNLRSIRQETGGEFDELIVTGIFLASVATIFLATRIKRLPVSTNLLLAIGGCTYPLYLLHQKLGYVIFVRTGGDAHPLLASVVILAAIAVLSALIWRHFEQPVQRWIKTVLARALDQVATRLRPQPHQGPRPALSAASQNSLRQ